MGWDELNAFRDHLRDAYGLDPGKVANNNKQLLARIADQLRALAGEPPPSPARVPPELPASPGPLPARPLLDAEPGSTDEGVTDKRGELPPPEVRQAALGKAKEVADRIRSGDKSPDRFQELAGHLGHMGSDDLVALRSHLGLAHADVPARSKAELRDMLARHLGGGRLDAAGAAAVAPPKEDLAKKLKPDERALALAGAIEIAKEIRARGANDGRMRDLVRCLERMGANELDAFRDHLRDAHGLGPVVAIKNNALYRERLAAQLGAEKGSQQPATTGQAPPPPVKAAAPEPATPQTGRPVPSSPAVSGTDETAEPKEDLSKKLRPEERARHLEAAKQVAQAIQERGAEPQRLNDLAAHLERMGYFELLALREHLKADFPPIKHNPQMRERIVEHLRRRGNGGAPGASNRDG
jgi:hypothetical protein